MTSAHSYVGTNGRNVINFHNLDDVQPSPSRNPAVALRPYTIPQQYQQPDLQIGRKQTAPPPSNSGFCTKRCVIGLIIGLIIGLLIAAAVAIPVGIVEARSQTTTMSPISTTPNWIGTYQMDNSCNTAVCCCLSNTMSLSLTSDGAMLLTGNLVGLCTGFTNNLSLAGPLPTGFQTYYNWYGEPVRLQLSQNSWYISFVNTIDIRCSASALKISSATSSTVNVKLGLVMCILLVAMRKLE